MYKRQYYGAPQKQKSALLKEGKQDVYTYVVVHNYTGWDYTVYATPNNTGSYPNYYLGVYGTYADTITYPFWYPENTGVYFTVIRKSDGYVVGANVWRPAGVPLDIVYGNQLGSQLGNKPVIKITK